MNPQSLKLPLCSRGVVSRWQAYGIRAWGTLRTHGDAASTLLRRLADVLVSAIGILVALPILTLAAGAMYLSSRGPILFVQERMGLYGRPFRMFKLRTMIPDADARKTQLARTDGATSGVRFKMKRDPRVTRVGQVLRKLSIDELPQLYNVLIGDMSLIGPRPAVRREVDLYDVQALRRLSVRPGLTCLWQVMGRSDLDFDSQVRLDLEYIDRRTLAGDIRILMKTVPAVLSGRGAY